MHKTNITGTSRLKKKPTTTAKQNSIKGYNNPEMTKPIPAKNNPKEYNEWGSVALLAKRVEWKETAKMTTTYAI